MSEISTVETGGQPEEQRRRKGRPVIAVGLALLAVGGIGAAATSAAWTDNVFFSAQAQAATFDLQGSLDGTTWKQSDNKGAIELVVPAAQLANMLPGETRTINLYVKNLGSVSAALTSSVEWAAGSTFTTNPTASVTGLAATLSPSTGSAPTDQFQLTVTAPADWAATNQGKTGTIIVTVAGTATA
ncbi:hypothetical protein ABZ477_16690 [Microbacterium sp. NPDC019599]|uniref:hypothetical protein n=1 Tax=Microbacterium sp. NPDC019599 TaxID=3154690 RepID=UPI0033E23888